MREAYHETLGRMTALLVEMAGLVGTAMTQATEALLGPDLGLAEQVIASDDRVDELYGLVEQQALHLLATQSPVAGDLRTVVTSLRIVADLERMGDLADHVASTARRRFPDSVVPAAQQPLVREMGRVAAGMAEKMAAVIRDRDVEAAAQLERDDDEMDELHRRLHAALRDASWADGTTAAIDLALLSRFYERYADHAVSIARRVVFLVTGERPVARPA